MLLVTWRDLRWRFRRIVLGLAAATLVLAMAALLGALHAAFLDETTRTVALFGADGWVVPEGGSGPFTSNSPIRADLAKKVAAASGASAATPVAIFRHTVTGVGEGFTDVNVIAYRPGGLVVPEIVAGRAPSAAGEAAADESLAAPLGSTLAMAGRTLRVVGLVSGVTYNGGTPTVLVTLAEGQRIAYAGESLASAIVVGGATAAPPKGLVVWTPEQVRDDLRRPLSIATGALALVAALLWVVAAGIVGMLAYLSGLDRHRELVVYKAFGVSTGRLLVSLVLEGVVVAVVAAVLAYGAALALAPAFAVQVSLGSSDALRLVAVALAVGLVASVVSVLRPVRVDPVEAFAAG